MPAPMADPAQRIILDHNGHAVFALRINGRLKGGWESAEGIFHFEAVGAEQFYDFSAALELFAADFRLICHRITQRNAGSAVQIN